MEGEKHCVCIISLLVITWTSDFQFVIDTNTHLQIILLIRKIVQVCSKGRQFETRYSQVLWWPQVFHDFDLITGQQKDHSFGRCGERTPLYDLARKTEGFSSTDVMEICQCTTQMAICWGPVWVLVWKLLVNPNRGFVTFEYLYGSGRCNE